MANVLAIIMAGGAGTRLSVLSEERSKPGGAVCRRGIALLILRSRTASIRIFIISSVLDPISPALAERPYRRRQAVGPGPRARRHSAAATLSGARARAVVWRHGGRGVSKSRRCARTARRPCRDFVGRPYLQDGLSPDAAISSGKKCRPDRRRHECAAGRDGPLWHHDGRRDMRINAFYEKPKKRDKGTLASMGIYIFNAQHLAAQLEAGQQDCIPTWILAST